MPDGPSRSDQDRDAADARPRAIEVVIESLAFGGEGLGRVDGKVRFVPGALPGERVLAEPTRARKQYDRMRVVEILEASPDRVAPLCSHTGVCGGCSLQALSYPRQLEAKATQVRDLLQRLGGVTIDEPFAPRAWRAEGPPVDPVVGPALGLHVPGRFDAVFDLNDCILPSEASTRAVRIARDFALSEGLPAYRSREDDGLLRHLIVREGANTGEVLIALVARHDDARFDRLAARFAEEITGLVGVVLILNRRTATIARGEEERLLFGRPTFRERLRGLEFELSAQSFFQTNTKGAEVLVEALARMTVGRGGRLLDLYCGAGTLGLCLAPGFDTILGVEQIAAAVADAKRNAERNRVVNASFLAADVEAWVREPEARPGAFDLVVVDPPRAGLHPKAMKGMIALGAPAMLYVSCNPSTLARDVALLREADYEPRELQIVDLFPHTAHVESIVRFERT